MIVRLRMLLENPDLQLAKRIEQILNPRDSFGRYFAKSVLRLLFQATAIANIADDGEKVQRQPVHSRVKFCQLTHRRVGQHFPVPEGMHIPSRTRRAKIQAALQADALKSMKFPKVEMF